MQWGGGVGGEVSPGLAGGLQSEIVSESENNVLVRTLALRGLGVQGIRLAQGSWFRV